MCRHRHRENDAIILPLFFFGATFRDILQVLSSRAPTRDPERKTWIPHPVRDDKASKRYSNDICPNSSPLILLGVLSLAILGFSSIKTPTLDASLSSRGIPGKEIARSFSEKASLPLEKTVDGYEAKGEDLLPLLPPKLPGTPHSHPLRRQDHPDHRPARGYRGSQAPLHQGLPRFQRHPPLLAHPSFLRRKRPQVGLLRLPGKRPHPQVLDPL